jgi:two-component system C4-dicarboxylate transport sensor histidine kinase DctB
LAVLAVAALALAIALWLMRQANRQVLQRAAQRELESKVEERTSELRTANEMLVREGEKRARSEERYRRSREELAQANRLATLGQVAAGVAHEINQPVAAIRTFAENASKFLSRGSIEKADLNLNEIVSLTDRTAQIVSELRSFARRRTSSVGPVALDDSIDGALLLLHHRIAAMQVAVEWDRAGAQYNVVADKVRLEQVFVNLFQNALDALQSTEGRRIAIRVDHVEPNVVVDIADNGEGVASNLARKLFTPFATGREDGLGLGLPIARDILREFGGDLEHASNISKGATFRARLVRA